MQNQIPKNLPARSRKAKEGWQKVRIGDNADVTKLAGFEFTQHVKYSDDGEIIALRALNLSDGQLELNNVQRIDRTTSEKLKRSKLFSGDILLSYTGTIGNFAIIKEDDKYHLAPNVSRIRVKEKYIPEFLYHYFRTRAFKHSLLGYSHGSSQSTIPMKNIREIVVPLPPLEHQRKIASVLSSFDDKIEVNNKIAKTLEEIAQTLFKEWFVHFRFPGYEKVEFVDSELRKIPTGWNAKFPDIAYFQEGPGIRNWQYKDCGTPFINIRCFKDQEIDLSDANYLDPQEVEKIYTHFLLSEGDFIVSSSGTLGRIAKVRKYHLPLVLNTSVIRVKPKDGFDGYCFIKYFLKSFYYQNQINAFATGSAQLNYGPSHLRQLNAIKPDEVVLGLFESITKPMEEKLDEIAYENQKLAALRDLLLPKLMKGEIKV